MKRERERKIDAASLPRLLLKDARKMILNFFLATKNCYGFFLLERDREKKTRVFFLFENLVVCHKYPLRDLLVRRRRRHSNVLGQRSFY